MSDSTQASQVTRLGELLSGRKTAIRPTPLRRDDVAFSLRSLEPWVAWAIAAHTGVITVMMHPQAYWLWLYVLYAGLVGKWAQVFPSRTQLQMFLRALSLLVAGFVLHIHAAEPAGGSGGIVFFWLATVALGYGGMLRPGWNWALVGLATFAYLLPALQGATHEPWLPILGRSVLLLLVPPLLTMRFGDALRRIEEALDESLVDRSTALYNKAGLLRHGEPLVAACLRDRKPVSLAVFDCAGLRQVHEVHGRRLGRQAIATMVRTLVRIAGEQGLAARTGPTEFTLVLPGSGRDRFLRVLEKELGSPPVFTLPAGPATASITPSFLVRAISGDADTLDELQAEMSRLLQGDTPSDGFAASTPPAGSGPDTLGQDAGLSGTCAPVPS